MGILGKLGCLLIAFGLVKLVIALRMRKKEQRKNLE